MELPADTLFVDTLNPDMDRDDFMSAIRTIVTDDDKKVLGENYEDQLAEAILYPAVFAPFPATFDSVAIAGIIDDVGSSDLQKNSDPVLDLEFTNTKVDRTAHLINRMLELGVIEPSEITGRFHIKPEVVEKLTPILNQFEE